MVATGVLLAVSQSVVPHPAAALPTDAARDDQFSLPGWETTQVPDPGVLGNDESRSHPLASIKVVAPPKHGRISGGMASGGGFLYTPSDVRFSGSDTFTYCLADAGECQSNVATVTLNLRAAVARPDVYSTPAGMTLDVPNISTNDDAGDLFWSLIASPSHGVLSNRATIDNGFRYSPESGYVGVDTFTYCLTTLRGVDPAACLSNTTTVTIRVGGPDVVRVGGADRFAVAAGVAQRAHPVGPANVVVASGEGYADALSAAPAAVKSGAALLLATRESLPAATAGEISRLQPMKVTVVGGPVAISDGVVVEIKRLLPAGAQVERIGGADRFVVSRAIAKQFFGTSAHSFVTTGLNFPDALAAGAAAGSGGEPVLMVNGQAETVDAETKAALSGLGTSRLAVVGGPNAVSNGIETTLKGLASVDRLMGADRYETAVAVSKAVFSTADTVYFATGLNFPDALVGSVVAGAGHSPIYTVPGNCVPQSVLADMARLGARHVVLLGGERALSPEVEQLAPCS
jgi:putative cell wall-binding protein